jgi:sigma-B regulation protein RsbU (phosphoserine phosphatase)
MKNQYAYKMDGLDADWLHTDASKRFATYTTLPAGDYIFRVKGSNNDGIWNEEGTSVHIVITPPVWQTWWFRLLFASLVFVFAFILYRERVKNVRMTAELRAAHDAQMSIMPQNAPQVEGLDIASICIPANEVGGDFFDFIWLDEDRTRLGIAVGDVSGKAMKSAMTAVMTDGMLYLEAGEARTISEILKRVNRSIFRKTDKQMFTALCLASLDIVSKELTYTNAGLNEPLLKSNGSVLFLKSVGPRLALGLVQDAEYEETNILLEPGAVLVFFTDGIPETQNHARQQYGEDRLRTLLARMNTVQLSAQAIEERIIADVKRFSGLSHQRDDMTIVVVKIT